jgi:transposase
VIATALVASIPDPNVFRSGRDLSAWIGLVPKQRSTGGKERLGHISKAGNRYLRKLLVVGALSADGTALDQGRGHCVGQQDCAHRLGHDGPWNTLPGTAAAGGMRQARARLALTRLDKGK